MSDGIDAVGWGMIGTFILFWLLIAIAVVVASRSGARQVNEARQALHEASLFLGDVQPQEPQARQKFKMASWSASPAERRSMLKANAGALREWITGRPYGRVHRRGTHRR